MSVPRQQISEWVDTGKIDYDGRPMGKAEDPWYSNVKHKRVYPDSDPKSARDWDDPKRSVYSYNSRNNRDNPASGYYYDSKNNRPPERPKQAPEVSRTPAVIDKPRESYKPKQPYTPPSVRRQTRDPSPRPSKGTSPPPPERRPRPPSPRDRNPHPKHRTDWGRVGYGLGMCAAFLVPLGLAIVAVGFGLPYWIEMTGSNVGLFQVCNISTSICSYTAQTLLFTINPAPPDGMLFAWQFTTAMTGVAIGMMVLALLMMICYPCMKKWNHTKMCVGVLICTLILCAGVCVIAAIAVMNTFYIGQNKIYPLSYSFYVATVGGCVCLLTGLIFSCHVCMACSDKNKFRNRKIQDKDRDRYDSNGNERRKPDRDRERNGRERDRPRSRERNRSRERHDRDRSRDKYDRKRDKSRDRYDRDRYDRDRDRYERDRYDRDYDREYY